MAIEYPATIPDLLTRFGLNPLSFSSYTDLLRELQALFNTAGTNPQGSGGTIDGRLDAIEAVLNQPSLSVAVADATPIVNITTETAFSTGSYIVPANNAIIGRVYRATASGVLSTTSSGPGTMTWRLRWGSATSSPLLVELVTPTLQVSLANQGWTVTAFLTVRSIGATGSATGGGSAILGLCVPTTAQSAVPSTLVAATATIDTTVNTPLTLFAKWSVASSNNTITMRSFFIEQVN